MDNTPNLELVIPYLMFAYDFMIFYEANRNATRQVKAILKSYCNILGQPVNFHNWSSSQKELETGKNDVWILCSYSHRIALEPI